MFYLLQAITILFAIYCAILNEVPVVKMIQSGASIKEEKRFHMANAAVKLIFSVAVALVLPSHMFAKIVTFLTLSLWQWIVFDIALNLCLHKTWDYIGTTAKIDKWLNKQFPHGDGGEVKAIACAVIIIALNILYSYL